MEIAAYKRTQRFLKRNDPRQVLGRLYQPDAEFMIGDPTEIERAQAWKTEYVGTLNPACLIGEELIGRGWLVIGVVG